MGSFNGVYSRAPYVMFNETKKYITSFLQASSAGLPIPIVDADCNDSELQKIVYLRRALQQGWGNGSPTSDGFYIRQGAAPWHNNVTVRGSDSGDLDEAGHYYVGGLPCMLDGDVSYIENVTPAIAGKIHHGCTAVGVDTIVDTAGCFEVDALIGRTLTILGTATGAVVAQPYTILDNDATTITVNVPPNPAVNGLAQIGDIYRIDLTTAVGNRTDLVWLDAYLDEIDGTEDPDLDHNIAAPSPTVVAALRGKVTQRVFVTEYDAVKGYAEGLALAPAGPALVAAKLAVRAPALATSFTVAAGMGALMSFPGVYILGTGRNEEIIYLTGIAGDVGSVDASHPLQWEHAVGEYLYPISMLDADGNQHYLSLLAEIDRTAAKAEHITNADITDYREQCWGSSAEVRDARLHLHTTLSTSLEERSHAVTIGTGVAPSLGEYNCSDYAGAFDLCFAAARVAAAGRANIIHIKPGTYTCATGQYANLSVANMHVFGSGDTTVITSTDTEPFHVNADYCTIQDLKVTMIANEVGIYIDGVSNTRVENVTFSAAANVGFAHIYDTNGASSTTITRCRFSASTNAYPAILLNGSAYSVVSHCTFFLDANATAAIKLDNSSSRISILNNISQALNYVVINDAASGACERITIDGAFLTSVGGAGATGVSINAPLAGSTVRVDMGRIYTYNVPTPYKFLHGNSIKVHDVHSYGATNFANVATDALNVIFSDFGAVSNTDRGIFQNATGVVQVSNGYIQNSGANAVGIHNNSTGVVLASNCYISGGLYGVKLEAATGASIIDNTVVTLATRVGFNVIGDHHRLNNCAAISIGGALAYNFYSISGDDNTLNNCLAQTDAVNVVAHEGFSLTGARNILNGCIASEFIVAGGTGILSSGDSATIRNCLVRAVTASGIDVSGIGTNHISDTRLQNCATVSGNTLSASGKVHITGLWAADAATSHTVAFGGVGAADSVLEDSVVHALAGQSCVFVTSNGVTIRNSRLIGGISGVSIGNYDQCKVDGCFISEYTTAGVLSTANAGTHYGLVVIDTEIVDTAGTNCIVTTANNEEVTIDGCKFTDSTTVGVIYTNSNLTSIKNCVFYDVDSFAIVAAAGSSVKVSCCEFNLGAGAEGVDLGTIAAGEVDNSIVDCTFRGGTAIICISGRTLIANNTISSGVGNGIYLHDTDAHHCVIANNIIYDVNNYAIYLHDCGEGNIIEGNNITDAFGIQIDNSNNTDVRGNYIGSSFGHGIYATNSSYVSLTANKVAAPTLDGIRCATAVNHHIVEGNAITTTGGYGIYLSDADYATVTANKINTITDSGIYATGSTRLKIDANHIYNATTDGISVSGTVVAINGNEIRTCGANGISTDGCSQLSVLNNTIEDATVFGVYANAFTTSMFNGNNIADCGEGMRLIHAPGTVGAVVCNHNTVYNSPNGVGNQINVTNVTAGVNDGVVNVLGVLIGNSFSRGAPAVGGNLALNSGVGAPLTDWLPGATFQTHNLCAVPTTT